MPQIVSQTRFKDGTNDDILERKIGFATAGLPAFIHKDLTDNVSSKNALSIAEYVLAMKTETNLSYSYWPITIQLLSLLSAFC